MFAKSVETDRPRHEEDFAGSELRSKALCIFDAANLVVSSICQIGTSVAGTGVDVHRLLTSKSLSDRAGVILTRPSSRPAGHGVRIDNALHRTISSSDQKEGSADQDKNVDGNQESPLCVADLPVPVVI